MAFGDKRYLGKDVFNRLLEKELTLITRVRKNMKEKNSLVLKVIIK